MTRVEKSKKSKKKKKNKKAQETEGEVLERVMDSIEMAGASLDFFEEEQPAVEESAMEEPESTEQELDAALADDSEEVVEEPVVETAEEVSAEAAGEVTEELGEDAETIDMLAEEAESELEFIEQKQAFSIIESILFSSDRPLGLGTFKTVFKGTQFKTKDIKKALEDMQSEYADPARGVFLEEINGGWQLRTKVDNMDFLRKLAKARPFKLSGPALETLAIVAYKQPIVKAEVDEIRGVESGHLIRALMEKHLVCFQGKSELPGKPMQYGTTRKFLEIFGLRNLRELPSLDEIDQLLPDGIGIEEDDEKLSDVTDSMSENYEGNYSEGEEELVKIESTLEGIDTSSEFFEEEKRRQRDKRDRDRARDIREALDVGEEVDSKDQRWLERYDQKQAEMAAAAEAASHSEQSEESVILSEYVILSENVILSEAKDLNQEPSEMAKDELIAAPESLAEEFENLTAETTLVDDETMALDAALESEDEHLEAAPVPEVDEEITEVIETEDDDTEVVDEFDPFEEGTEEESE